MMAARTIFVTTYDMDRLLELIEGVRSTPRYNKTHIDLLERELCAGVRVDSTNVPHDVITMNSKVSIPVVESGEITNRTVPLSTSGKRRF